MDLFLSFLFILRNLFKKASKEAFIYFFFWQEGKGEGGGGVKTNRPGLSVLVTVVNFTSRHAHWTSRMRDRKE